MSENEKTQDQEKAIKSAYEKAMERLDAEAESSENTESQDDAQSPEAEQAKTVQATAEVVEEQAINIDFKDKYLRSCAELENYRKRVNRDKETWRSNAIRGMAMSFIDILDNLNLALTTTASNEVPNDESFVKGVTAVRDQFKNQLEQRGVRQIETKSGDPFDPDLHEALMMQESPDVEGQVVGAILRPGYMLEKTVLRPAQIQVLKGS